MRVVIRAALAVLLLVSLLLPRAAAAGPDPVQLLKKSDEVRLPASDYTLLARVTSYTPGREPTTGIYQVMAKGKETSLIKTLAPPSDKGRLLLLRDNNLWAYLPTVSKPVGISLRERLIGDVANADIVRASFSGDYTPVVKSTQTIDGKPTAILELTAKDGHVAYAKVMLWVDTQQFRPSRAEFYGLSGRLLKTCTYERYAELAGGLRPTRTVMIDPLRKDQYSVIDYSKMEAKALPEKYFTDDYIQQLSVRQ